MVQPLAATSDGLGHTWKPVKVQRNAVNISGFSHNVFSANTLEVVERDAATGGEDYALLSRAEQERQVVSENGGRREVSEG